MRKFYFSRLLIYYNCLFYWDFKVDRCFGFLLWCGIIECMFAWILNGLWNASCNLFFCLISVSTLLITLLFDKMNTKWIWALGADYCWIEAWQSLLLQNFLYNIEKSHFLNARMAYSLYWLFKRIYICFISFASVLWFLPYFWRLPWFHPSVAQLIWEGLFE